MEVNINFVNLDNFNWYYKNIFNWSVKYTSKNRMVFYGEKKDNSNYSVIIKKIKIDYNYERILKEIYFLACCRRSKYFIKLVDVFLSKDNNYIYLILKDEGINLSELIDYEDNEENGFNYRKIDKMIKWIIFQIVSGLYILHKSKLLHNDIKPGNILISSTGVVKIGDFGSVEKSELTRYGTTLYESPDALLGKKSNEKDDMWAVGIILVELYKKKFPFFDWRDFNFGYINNNNINQAKEIVKNLQLQAILSKYKITINNNEININNIDNFNYVRLLILNNNYNFKEELNIIDGIEDLEALDLIKNLLKINPQQRFTAEQALNSNYLSEYRKDFQQCDITYEEIDYEDLLKKVYNKNIFIKNVQRIKQKYIGEILFD